MCLYSLSLTLASCPLKKDKQRKPSNEYADFGFAKQLLKCVVHVIVASGSDSWWLYGILPHIYNLYFFFFLWLQALMCFKAFFVILAQLPI